MHYVIGSGPAGISCARALIDAGAEVTLLDAGLTLEPERETIRVAMSARGPTEWSDQEREAFAPVLANGEVPTKLVYGSDYPYRAALGATPVLSTQYGQRGSWAQGGLSNVWGSAILPYRDHDLLGWPVRAADLAASYQAVLKFMPMAAQIDDLSEMLPLYGDAQTPLPRSRQAANLFADLKAHKSALNAAGVRFGGARVAVWSQDCNLCGACLNGCPRALIYSTRPDLAALQSTGKLHYVPAVVVKKLQETPNGVIIHAQHSDGSPQQFAAKRVFLAAGVINSTEIMLRSMGRRHASLLDSQYFILPLLRAKASPKVGSERLHTLSQLFMEIDDPQISPFGIHLQIYSYNEILAIMLTQKLGPLHRMFPSQMLLGRMLVVQGYLHSTHSGRIDVTLEAGNNGEQLRVEAVRRAETVHTVGNVVRKLSSLARSTRMMPLSSLLQLTEPGRGFHSGGSFPMARSPGAGETDIWGRPHAMPHVHLVDASVFPSIPATTITLSVMANAYRIGRDAILELKD